MRRRWPGCLPVTVQVTDRHRSRVVADRVGGRGFETVLSLLRTSTLTVFASLLAVARSGFPSPSRSLITTDRGRSPTGWVVAVSKPVLSLLRNSTLTVLALWLAVARLGFPSPSRSPIATVSGTPATWWGVAALKTGVVALAQQHTDGVRVGICGGQVGFPVAVQVTDRH